MNRSGFEEGASEAVVVVEAAAGGEVGMLELVVLVDGSAERVSETVRVSIVERQVAVEPSEAATWFTFLKRSGSVSWWMSARQYMG